MPTPVKGYYINGDRVPGTTTVKDRFGDSGGLKYWCWQQGYEQGKTGEPFEFMKSAKKAADIGTVAHAAIEAMLNGLDPHKVIDEMLPDDEDAKKALNAFNMYEKWERQTNLKLLSKFQEIQLISHEYKFGGTPDAIGEIDGDIVLLDWKTSNAVYPDHLIQLAAYQHLINHGVRMDTGEPLPFKVSGGAHLLRFAKDYPDFGHHYFGDLQSAWRQFQLFREAYEIDKELKKRAA